MVNPQACPHAFGGLPAFTQAILGSLRDQPDPDLQKLFNMSRAQNRCYGDQEPETAGEVQAFEFTRKRHQADYESQTHLLMHERERIAELLNCDLGEVPEQVKRLCRVVPAGKSPRSARESRESFPRFLTICGCCQQDRGVVVPLAGGGRKCPGRIIARVLASR